ncbi:hypothetical protein [Myroides sp. DF42-4-2]|uniref:hypothetical protein n=1 Tax=Myroides sp. DF42-4-2 TaxID=2746726 RepID=UPI002574D3AA|nr:hypothetical protein [Myroides sp. DF42-4-2]
MYNVEVDDGEYSILFYESTKMLEYHLEHGYNVDLAGKGCFFVGVKTVMLDAKATLFELNGESNFEPAETNFILSKVSYCNLIVPDYIEDDEFSKKMYNDFYEILKKDSSGY